MSSLDAPSATRDGTGIRKALKRWKDRWRTTSTRSSRTSSPKAPPSRVASNASAAARSHKRVHAVPEPRRRIPASPPRPTALFTPTTETTIHSPADARNRSGSTWISSTPSPPGTLRKPRPVPRRNTAPSEVVSNALYDGRELPMNVVTTTIVAGNGEKRKRTSRLRLSISRRGSILASSPSGPATNGHFERSSSRAASRLYGRAGGRFQAVPESGSREGVESEGERLLEEIELMRPRPDALARPGEVGTVELAYRYVGSRDGNRG